MFSLGVIQRMNAKEARKRARANKKDPRIDHLLDVVDQAIKAATQDGKCEITKNPLEGLRTPISPEQFQAVWANLKDRGFKVTIKSHYFSVSW